MDSARHYQQDLELIKNFFTEFTEKYGPKLTEIANRDAIRLDVDLADVESFNLALSNSIVRRTNRYTQLFNEALDELLPSYKTKEAVPKDNLDIIIQHRLEVARRHEPQSGIATAENTAPVGNANLPNNLDIDNQYPPELLRRFEVYFIPVDKTVIPVREVLAKDIGHLVSVRGLITRCSEVKSQIVVATYVCENCGCETFQLFNEPEMMPLVLCTSAVCKESKTPGSLRHLVNGSRFIKAQEMKVQELSDQVPTGDIPRTIRVLTHGELTRSCNSGDQVLLSGVFLTLEKKGYRQGGHSSEIYIEAQCIKQMSKNDDQEFSDDPMTMEEAETLMTDTPNFADRISASIAPEIYGHVELKKALLLLLIGGVEKIQSGAKTRGDINICLMGDPGVAKSQLLSFVNRLASRSQYTTGRGSSGVGLTAAVMRDPITDEVTLEGGALVLADRGVCCIDEFDKMMDADRTAIHEVMEQQTVSIAKAGINTTLNARVSILAAANPSYGRYNIYRSITDNLRLPPALLSRFDLLWLIKDHSDESKDLQLAQHITAIHTDPEAMISTEEAIDMKTIRRFIKLCKTKNPFIMPNQEDRLVQIFLEIRKKKRPIDKSLKEDTLFTSPRSLLAITRLATAFARLRLADSVDFVDIENAVKLYEDSKKSIEGSIDPAIRKEQNVLRAIRELSFDEEGKPNFQMLEFDAIHSFNDSLTIDDLKACLNTLHRNGNIEYNLQTNQILYTP